MSVYDTESRSSGSVSGSVYDTARSTSKKKKGGGGFGLDDLGFAGNVVGDVKDIAVNIPGGVKATVTDPIGTAKAIGRSYADTYGQGFGHFLHTFYEHPVPIAADALTLITGVGAVAGRTSATLGKAGEITLRSPAARAGELAAATVTKTTSRNPVIRVRQTAVHNALQKLPTDLPVLGEDARFTRATKRGPAAAASVLRQENNAYNKAFAALSKNERKAFHILARLPTAELLDGWRATLQKEAARGNTDAKTLLADLDNPKILKLYDKPTKAITRTLNEASKLGDRAVQEMERLGLLSKTQAEEARYRHAILASGGQIRAQEKQQRMLRSPAWIKAKKRVVSLQKRYDRLEAKGERGGYKFTVGPDGEAAVTEADVTYQASKPTLERIGAALSVAKDELARIEARYGRRADQPAPPDIPALREQIAAAGRPQPVYIPDVPKRAERRGGGNNVSYSSPVNKTQGLLFLTGRLALEPDVLGPQFLRVVTYAHFRDLHDGLLDASVKILPGGSLPEGWRFVKKPPNGFEAGVYDLLNNPDEIPEGLAARGLTTHDSGQALLDGGARYAVPGRMARQFEAEFKRGSSAARWFIEKPTTVWRALVLNLRVAWLVNNVVGNHLLYSLRYAGPNGLRAYLAAVATSKGATKVRELLHMPETRRVFTSEDIAELIPEQASGTFIGTQAPSIKGGRTLRRAGLGLATADKAIEGGLRRAAVNAELRKHPAVKARLQDMPKETRSFREAARREIEANPQVARDVSEAVNRALGDFHALSPIERRYVRAVFPFYAWYRAITQIALRLPLDTPGRAALLAQLAEIGKADTEAGLGPLPSYLEGSLPLGEDRLLKTQGPNPFATIPQLGRAAAVPFFPGQRTNALAGTMNPFVQALGGLVFGKEATKRGLAADFGAGIATDLPQVALAKSLLQGPAESKLYQPSSTDDLLAFLGVGVKTINRKRAAELAAQGR